MKTFSFFLLLCCFVFSLKPSALGISTSINSDYSLLFDSRLPQRIYVNASADSAIADGTSWLRAFPDLAYVLSKVAQKGDTIWVAEGFYYPTKTNDRSVSFAIPSGVVLLGGFKGDETVSSKRNAQSNLTRLSGDVGLAYVEEDNSYHVLQLENIDKNTVLDGFVIERGYAIDAPNTPFGAGLYLKNNTRNNPVIKNCNFLLNQALEGGAVYVQNSAEINLTLENCSFSSNKSKKNGGALYINSEMPGSRLVISGSGYCWSNEAEECGGAFFIKGTFDTVGISGQDFFRNFSKKNGAGMYLQIKNNLSVNYCRFRENNAKNGAGIYLSHEENVLFSNPQESIDNCFFQSNKSDENGAGIYLQLNHAGILNLGLYNTTFYLNSTGLGGAAVYIKNNRGRINFTNKFSNFFNNEGQSGEAIFSYIEDPINNGFPLFFQAQFINSIFSFNTSGALNIQNSIQGSCETSFFNCNFWNNGGVAIRKNWSNLHNKSHYNKATLTNCIIWEESGKRTEDVFKNSGLISAPLKEYYIEYSMLGTPDCNINPGACGEGNIFDTNPMFKITSGGVDFRLPFCSSGINAGKALDILPARDINFNPRVLQGRVDIGALEQIGYVVDVKLEDSISCPGYNDGKIAISANGTKPYQYFLDNQPFFHQNISAGQHLLRVVDSLGCKREVTINVPDKDSIKINHQIKNASSIQATDGGITIRHITGGTPPYQLKWSNQDTGMSINHLIPGNYALTIVDKNNCSQPFSFKVDILTNLQDLGLSTPQILLKPNPCTIGNQLSIIYNHFEPGQWKMKILAINGHTLHQQTVEFIQNKGLMVIPYVFLDQGFYVVSLLNPRSGDHVTEKIWISK
ncbi:hypothetical protein [Haliscomenobacter hydrossis]|uniref:Polymorphic membrane protein Chlamydia n=1 Tax=Haliscomenobacter hydrossis (strain ATCC 27775 / DSM 1100 / LMG 10767 / O) TaxID=760192 RepID=F4KYV0_HALH1|nr:hypothetical protein [Haliscomenobacter hydrossis]AEE51492.1 Polymorphic membrane protein Chlamydia [Haliscomenobacter hydrossis DSM 1100]